MSVLPIINLFSIMKIISELKSIRKIICHLLMVSLIFLISNIKICKSFKGLFNFSVNIVNAQLLLILILSFRVSFVESQELIGKILDVNNKPVENANIYLSFTYPGNQSSFFDYVPDESTLNLIRKDTIYAFPLLEPCKVNLTILNRKYQLRRTFIKNLTYSMGGHSIPFTRLSNDSLIMKDDVYLNYFEAFSTISSAKFLGLFEYFYLSGLSKEVIFNPKHKLESWAITNYLGNFSIPIEDLPIGYPMPLVVPKGYIDTVQVDSLIGIAVVSGDEYHYDSIRVKPDSNYIEMVLDKVLDVNSKGQENDLPQNYSLLQNYPNPFNPETIIHYELPKQTRVRITIYNISGQLIQTLVDEIQPSGYYNVIWDGKNQSDNKVSSGIYFYRMVTDNYIKTNKMIMLK